jgi:hypothetical protein
MPIYSSDFVSVNLAALASPWTICSCVLFFFQSYACLQVFVHAGPLPAIKMRLHVDLLPVFVCAVLMRLDVSWMRLRGLLRVMV